MCTLLHKERSRPRWPKIFILHSRTPRKKRKKLKLKLKLPRKLKKQKTLRSMWIHRLLLQTHSIPNWIIIIQNLVWVQPRRIQLLLAKGSPLANTTTAKDDNASINVVTLKPQTSSLSNAANDKAQPLIWQSRSSMHSLQLSIMDFIFQHNSNILRSMFESEAFNPVISVPLLYSKDVSFDLAAEHCQVMLELATNILGAEDLSIVQSCKDVNPQVFTFLT